jgi:hypothetical protein
MKTGHEKEEKKVRVGHFVGIKQGVIWLLHILL